MQKKRKQFPTITVVLTTILFVVLSLIAVIGCEEQPTESDPDPVDNSTAPGMVIINDISDNDINSNSIEISWEAPDAGKNANGTAATITGYKVYYKAGDTVTESDGILLNEDNADKGVQTATTATITDLITETQYAFIVAAINSAGKTSTSVAVIEIPTAATAPAAASINTIDVTDLAQVTANTITISWTEPADTGKNANGTAATITGYKVYYKAGDKVTESDGILLNEDNADKGVQTATTATITDLITETQYAFIVVAINSAGKTSTSVAVIEIPTAATAPSAASINTIDVTDLAQVTANRITISWTEPADAGKNANGTAATITGYKVYYKAGDKVTESDGTLLNKDNADKGVQTATTATITDLITETQYAFIVVAINSAGKTSTSVAVIEIPTAATAPAAASINTIDATDLAQVTANSIKISWDAPDAGKKADGTAATITGYKVYYKADDTVTESDGILLNKDNAEKGVQTATTATITDLAGLTKYAFIVITINSENQSSTSEMQTTTTLNASSDPNAVTINTIDATDLAQVTANTITISWTEPADAGKNANGTAATITGYKVYYKAGDTVTESDGILLNEDNADKGVQTATTATITDLITETQYAFIVVAINSAGKTSTSVAVIEIPTAATAPAAASINSIDATDAAQVTANTITISWTEPVDAGKNADGTAATITVYKVYYTAGNTLSDISANGVKELTAAKIEATTRTATIEGLLSNTDYAIVVVTANSMGLTSTSTANTVATASKLSQVTLMTSAVASTSLGLVWATPSDAGKESNGTDATISSYKVFYQEGTSLDYSTATKLDPSNTTHDHQNGREVIITGLTMNTQYSIGIRTTNSAGATSDSNPVTLSTKHYTKLGTDGSVLTIQNGTWSHDSSGNDNGTESAGTIWSCVRDEGTGLVWEVKTNKATADVRDKDLEYQWGGLTAIGEGDPNREGSYYDDWNALVLHANDQQLTSATDDGDATETNSDSKTVLCGTSTSGSNWRVPTLMELSTIINYNTHSPAYDATMFPNTQASFYWSSSPYAYNSNYAWRMHFGYGYDNSYNRTNSYYVRLVRGSQ